MPKPAAPIRPVIVKKIYEAPHSAHHGGAWKRGLCRLRHGDDGILPF